MKKLSLSDIPLKYFKGIHWNYLKTIIIQEQEQRIQIKKEANKIKTTRADYGKRKAGCPYTR